MARIYKCSIYFKFIRYEVWKNDNSQLSIRMSQICLSRGYLWRSIIQENTPETLIEPMKLFVIYLLKLIPYAESMVLA